MTDGVRLRERGEDARGLLGSRFFLRGPQQAARVARSIGERHQFGTEGLAGGWLQGEPVNLSKQADGRKQVFIVVPSTCATTW